jgi:hypothetical protein
MVPVLVGQILHETGFVVGTNKAFVNSDFLMKGVVMPLPCLHGPQEIGILHRDSSPVLQGLAIHC